MSDIEHASPEMSPGRTAPSSVSPTPGREDATAPPTAWPRPKGTWAYSLLSTWSLAGVWVITVALGAFILWPTQWNPILWLVLAAGLLYLGLLGIFNYVRMARDWPPLGGVSIERWLVLVLVVAVGTLIGTVWR